MRIALLTHEFPPSTGTTAGGESADWLRARALAERGHEVHVFAGSDRPIDRTAHDGALTITRYRRDDALTRRLTAAAASAAATDLLTRELCAALRDQRHVANGLQRALRANDRHSSFDFVLCPLRDAAAGLLVRGQGVPVVVTVDESGSLDHRDGLQAAGRLAHRGLARALLREADAICVASEELVDRVVRFANPPAPVAIIREPARPEPATSAAADESEQSLLLTVLADTDLTGTALHDALEEFLAADSTRRIALLGPDEVAHALDRARCETIEATPPAIRRDWLQRADLTLVATSEPDRHRRDLLSALRSGRATIALETGASSQLLRTEVDGLAAPREDAAAITIALDRFVDSPDLAARLGAQAAERVAERHDPNRAAERLEAFVRTTLLARPAEADGAEERDEPVALLGTEDWHEAWWLRGHAPVATDLDRDADGNPTLLDLPLPELHFVIQVLTRAYTEQVKDWNAPEWQLVLRLRRGELDRLAEERSRMDAAPESESAAGPRLGLPELIDPPFPIDRVNLLLDELWRLQGDEPVGDWLERQVDHPDFVRRARDEDVTLRRLAAEAAEQRPGLVTYEALRRIYRDAGHHATVVTADRQAIASGKLARFEEFVVSSGLHAPVERPAFPQPERKVAATPTLSESDPHPSGPNPSEHARITVLIPSYKHEGFIGPAIESCLAQTASGVRVVVADDRSPDGTVAVARAIDDPRLEVHVNETNLGLGASVLAALDRIETSYVALLNSDDLFHPERLQRAVEILDADPDAGLVATGFDTIDRDSRVLTADTSTLVEDGPQAHGWLRWFAEVTADLVTATDWTDLATLLRHNVLATSSNMVFRTDYLRRHMPAARSLRYCLDWQLFLIAAAEKRLRYVPEPLLAYRFHDSNTVWFKHGERGDYVLEVNRVVDRVLDTWLHERTRAGTAPQQAMTDLADLLQRHASKHGETDGYALYAAALARSLEPTGSSDAADTATPPPWQRLDLDAEPITDLAEAALLRSTLDQVAPEFDCDPWSLPWRARAADRLAIESAAADGFVQRTRDLQSEIDNTRRERDALRERAEDFADVRRSLAERVEQLRQRGDESRDQAAQIRTELAEVRQNLASVRNRRDELREQLDEAKASAKELRGEKQQLRSSLQEQRALANRRTEELQRERKQLGAERRRAAIQLTDVERQLRDANAVLAERDAALGAAEREAKRLGEDLDKTTSELETARQEAEQLVASRDEAIAAATLEQDVRSLLERRLQAAEKQLDELRASPSWRLGHAWLDRRLLLRGFKTLDDLVARSRERLWRLATHAARRLSGRGRARQRVLLAIHDRPDHPLPDPVDFEAALWRHAGFDLRCVQWNVDRGEGLGGRRLRDRASLERTDRDYWKRRRPEALADLEAALGANHPLLGRTLRFARVAKTTGAGLTLCHGLDGSALQAWAALQLADIPYALILGGHAAARRELPRELSRRVLETARMLVVDSATVEAELDSGRRGLPPLRRLLPQRLFDASPWSSVTGKRSELRLLTVWPTFARADGGTLARAVARLQRSGASVHVDVLGEPGNAEVEIRSWARFVQACRQADVSDLFTHHGSVNATRMRELGRSCDAIVWCGAPEAGAGLPQAVPFAWACGRPIFATATPAVAEWLSSSERGRTFPVGDAAALAKALRRLLDDPDAERERAATTQRWFTAEQRPIQVSEPLFEAAETLLGSGCRRP